MSESLFQIERYSEALNELEKMEPVAKAHPDVLLLRLDILLALRRWEDAAALGEACCRDWRTFGAFFIKTADALMRQKDFGKALIILEDAPASLHEEPGYHYTLAQCAFKEGRIKETKRALEECFKRDQSFRRRALEDPDFR